MAQALDQVKQCFGGDAVIVNTRTGMTGGLFGLGARSFVEITAAPHTSDLPASPRRDRLAIRTGCVERADGAAARMSPTNKTMRESSSGTVLSEVAALRSMVSDLVLETRRSRVGILPDALYNTYQGLVANEVAEQISHQLIEQVRSNLTAAQLADPAAVRAQLAIGLERMLPTAGPIHIARGQEPKTIALVGPTGVGKTTTIAKLAANLCLREHRKVGLITIDTYRIAAVEQLRTYAQIIDVPLDVAVSPTELKQAVERMADRDVILIDTAGRSQKDTRNVKELRLFFEQVRPDEIHLVLSSACSKAVLNDTIERFSVLNVDRIIFTKLDEATGFGVIVSCLQKTTARLSYVTTGQDVPDDIRVGERQMLAELILGRFP